MKSLIFLILFLTMNWQIAAQQNDLPPEIREMARKVMMPVVYKVGGMDKVKIVSNLKYKKSDDPNILMDVYLPPDLRKDKKRPIVIFVHGGAMPEWTPKDWGVFQSWGKLIAASGMVGVTFTHRLKYPEKSLENAAADVTDAIEYIRQNADKYNADKDRICLMTFSAGGAMLPVAMQNDMPFVKCLVGFYSFLDLQKSKYKRTETPETIKKFSAITYLEKDAGKLPPMFVARAGRDEVPMMDDSIDRFVQAAIAKNLALTFANHPNGVHAFDNQNNDNRSREIIRQAIDFMKIHLSVG